MAYFNEQKVADDIEVLKIQAALTKRDLQDIQLDVSGVRNDVTEIKELITGAKGSWKTITILFTILGVIVSSLGYSLFGKLFKVVS